ncbi:hypothetical protein K227x_12350 [Rubripirellula lacrimiformis]|uniref:Uncharacterized protein n=1 Tax=Rubripirellula lacrimiformis TaxID=1930273 RepID=A0A517N6T1_9BACT|nr:hypothetical protein K227x_12350 [Rubripirellula lacrimiformis]
MATLRMRWTFLVGAVVIEGTRGGPGWIRLATDSCFES